MIEEKKKCRYCGSDITPGSYYCNTCGEVEDEFIEKVEDMGKGSPETPEGKKITALALAVILAIGVLMLVLYFGLSRKDATTASDQAALDALAETIPDTITDFPEGEDSFLGHTGNIGPVPSGNPSWMVNIGTTISGAPQFADGRLYVIAEDVLELAGAYEIEIYAVYNTSLFAIDPENGEILWSAELLTDEKVREAQLIEADGDIYVIVTTNEIVFDEEDMAITEAEVQVFHFNGEFGYEEWPSSVIIEDSTLIGATVLDDVICISTNNRSGQGEIRGLSKERGRELWKNSHSGMIGPPGNAGDYFSVTRSEEGSVSLFIGSSDTLLVLIEPETGDEIFARRTGFTDSLMTPVHVGRGIICGGEWAGGRIMIENIFPGEKESSWRWDEWLAGEEMPVTGMVALSGRCIFAGPKGIPVILDITNGEKLASIEGEIEKVIYPPVSNGDRVFFVTGDGSIAAVDPASGEPPLKFELPDRFVPTSDGGVVYGDGRLFLAGKNGLLLCIE